MTIKVYDAPIGGKLLEEHQWSGTFTDFLKHNKVDYLKHSKSPIIFLKVNGKEVGVSDWSKTFLSDDEGAEVRPTSHGSMLLIGAIAAAAAVAATFLLRPNIKGLSSSNTPRGRQLEAASAEANQVKIGETVPELIGRHRRFPDYLTPPRRYFSGQREQKVEFLACIGPGRYLINDADVKIGDTPISAIDSSSYRIFEPNADMSEFGLRDYWHTVEEVGATSSGTAGLELTHYDFNRENENPPSYTFGSSSIARSSGSYPPNWGAGTTINVEYPQTYSVSTVTIVPEEPEDPELPADEPYRISEITGYFGHLGGVGVGSLISLGSIGNYEIYRIISFESASGSNNRVRLESESGVPLLLPSGNHTLIFGANVNRTITSLSSTSISVTPGGFRSQAIAGANLIFTGGTIYGEWASEFVVTPGNEETALIEVDFFFPQGLNEVKDNGDLTWREVHVEILVRNLDTGSTVIFHRTFRATTMDAIGFSLRYSVPIGKYAVSARRTSEETKASKYNDKCNWYGLKCRIFGRRRYPDWTTISISVESGSKLSAQSENKVNVVATRILPTLQENGSWGSPEPTTDISAAVRYIAHSIGYTDDDLDMVELRRLHNIWKARSETFSHVFELTTVKEALDAVLVAGKSQLTVAGGLIRPVRDDVRTQFEEPYSPQNMTSKLKRSFSARSIDDNDGVRVEYIDAETWKQESIDCAVPASPRRKLLKMQLTGAYSKVEAWRIGMRRARELWYRRWQYSFSTEMDALNSEYLSYVPLISNLKDYGQSALLTHVDVVGSNTILRVSEEIQWQDGKDHVIAYRKADGTLAGPWPATKVGDFMVQAPIPASERPIVSLKMELPHVYIGTTEEWCFPALVTDITPRGTDSVSVSAVNYDARIYTDDDNYPPN